MNVAGKVHFHEVDFVFLLRIVPRFLTINRLQEVATQRFYTRRPTLLAGSRAYVSYSCVLSTGYIDIS